MSKWLYKCSASDDEDAESALPGYPGRGAAKSFSAAAQLRPVVPLVPEARTASIPLGPSPHSVKYSSISQFSQRIELYRGRSAFPLYRKCM